MMPELLARALLYLVRRGRNAERIPGYTGGGGLNQASDVPPGEPGYRKVVLPSAEAQK